MKLGNLHVTQTRSALYCVLVIGLSVMTSADELPVQTGPESAQTVQFVWEGIRKAVRDEISANSPILRRPEFTLTHAGNEKQLVIKRGVAEFLGFGDDLYGFAFKAQMTIELVRDSLNSIDPSILEANNCGAQAAEHDPRGAEPSPCRQSLLQVLGSAEVHVREMISLLLRSEYSSALRSQLQKQEQDVAELIGSQFYDLVEKSAETLGIGVVFVRGASAPDLLSIDITSAPLGAKISLMTELAFRRQVLSKVEQEKWPWTEIVQSPTQLLGRYRYKAQWPDGVTTEGTIEVRSASAIRISEK